MDLKNREMIKRIAILGSTGSIGRQALEVIREFRDAMEVEVLTAGTNWETLVAQALEFMPSTVVIGREAHYRQVSEALDPAGIKVFTGEEAIAQVVSMGSVDLVLNALVGYSGFIPTLETIRAGKVLALANKESMVVGGEMVAGLAAANRVPIIPVDSEHSAIFQCMTGEDFNTVEKIILTASGGPFRQKSLEFLHTVKKEDALKHPNWSMGHKITIDSASLMNKGLEVIEARWLFDIDPGQIEVVVHPQSVIHSLVQFHDGSMKAQMGTPDMRLPITYALNYPERKSTSFPRFSFLDYPELTFEKPDIEIFRNLALAYRALQMGGNACCTLNASNEEAVRAFLCDRIGFMDIPEIIEKCLLAVPHIQDPSLEDYELTDREARKKAKELVKKLD